MIFKESFIYFFFLPLLILLLCTFSHVFYRKLSQGIQWLLVLSFSAYFVLLIGFRDISIGADTVVYASPPRDLAEMFNGKDLFFLLLHRVFYVVGGEEYLFILFSILSFFLIISNSYLLLPREIILPFTFFLISMSFMAFSVNILRQGLSIYSFSLFVTLLTQKRFIRAIFFLIASIALHRYTSILIVVFILSYYIKKDYFLWIAMLFVLVIALRFKSLQDFLELNELYDFSYEDWLLDEYNLVLGINWLMIAFNCVFIFEMCIIYFKYKTPSITDQLSPLFFSFSFLTVVFMIAMNFPYSDRIGQLSWSIIPLFLVFLSKFARSEIKLFKFFLVFDLLLLVNIQFYFLFLKV